jgi:hypothetical protein
MSSRYWKFESISLQRRVHANQLVGPRAADPPLPHCCRPQPQQDDNRERWRRRYAAPRRAPRGGLKRWPRIRRAPIAEHSPTAPACASAFTDSWTVSAIPGSQSPHRNGSPTPIRTPARSRLPARAIKPPGSMPAGPVRQSHTRRPDKTLAKTCADFSDLEIGPDGCLYLLSDKSSTIARLDDLPAVPFGGMICWPVSKCVGSVKNNDASLVEPITLP